MKKKPKTNPTMTERRFSDILAALKAARDRADAHNKLIEELQALGEEFGCVGGQKRTDWLRGRLEKLRAFEQSHDNAK